MPEKVEAFYLLDPRLDKQAEYNAGKMAHKLCVEKKHCVQAVFETCLSDNAVLANRVRACTSSEETQSVMSEIGKTILVSNVETDTPGATFVSGFASANEMLKLEKQLEEAAAKLDKSSPFSKLIRDFKKNKKKCLIMMLQNQL